MNEKMLLLSEAIGRLTVWLIKNGDKENLLFDILITQLISTKACIDLIVDEETEVEDSGTIYN